MALHDGFPSATGVADANDVRLGFAGLVVKDASGNPRTGVFPRSTSALVTSSATMNSVVAAAEFVVSRSGQGVITLANDGNTNVLHDAAPVSNKRLDLIYVKQNDAVSPNADADSLPHFGILKGTASATPTAYTYATAVAALAAAPGIGAGAEPIAVVEIPSTASATNSVGVVYTQLYRYTATAGGVIHFRNTTERDASTYCEGQLAWLIDTDQLIAYNGTSWNNLFGDVWLQTTTFSSQTTITLDNLPTGFTGYRIELVSDGTAATLSAVLRTTGGTDVTTSNYDRNSVLGRNGAAESGTVPAQASWAVSALSNTDHHHIFEIERLTAAAKTSIMHRGGVNASPMVQDSSSPVYAQRLHHRLATAYGGIKFTFSANQSGYYRVMGRV